MNVDRRIKEGKLLRFVCANPRGMKMQHTVQENITYAIQMIEPALSFPDEDVGCAGVGAGVYLHAPGHAHFVVSVDD